MQHFALVLLFACAPVCYLLAGEWAFETAFAALTRRGKPPAENAGPILDRSSLLAYLLGGLLIILCAVFALACIGVPLWAASLGAFLAPAVRRHRAGALLRKFRPALSLNFLLWTTVSLILGATLIGTADGYQTAWRNNYADFAWHMGIISSFTFGENFPPQNHIFPPQNLSYPFFVNLWTTTFWVFDPVPAALGWIFIYQWVFVWTAVYIALDGNRWRMLPWAALLGGGSYTFVFRTLNGAGYPELATLGPYAYDLLNNGYPWVPFLDSIWVPQRPALFGAPILLTSVHLGHMALFGDSSEEREKLTFFAALLLGLSPLVHTHLFLVATCYLGLLFALRTLPSRDRRANAKLFALFLLGLSPAFLFAPWILGKSGIVKIAVGWMQGDLYDRSGLFAAMVGGFKLWWANGRLWFLATALVCALGRRYAAGAVFTVLFLLGNVFQIAAWNWDEIKIFLALFLISLSLWQTVPTPRAKIAHWALALLIVPGCVELWVVLNRYENLTVYNRAELRDAELMRKSTPADAIIAAKPDHNSPVTLTGRKLYYGYEGTLASHGIPHDDRRAIQIDFAKLKSCRLIPEKPLCPDYVFWSWRERDYWKRSVPGAGVTPTEHYFLYQFP